jgi:hypothetical protein
MIRTEIIPVIHMINQNQVMTNVDTCVECGVEKVFLINHVVTVQQLLDCALTIKLKYPKLWVGVNMLGTSTEDALTIDLPEIDGVWCDASITPRKAKIYRNFKGLFFGGLAFKYQPQPDDLESACIESKQATDVSTTSGPATGKAADVEKIKQIREYLGNHPMAIASGVSIQNIDSYKGIANYLLVASSVTSKTEMIYEDKLKELLNKL